MVQDEGLHASPKSGHDVPVTSAQETPDQGASASAHKIHSPEIPAKIDEGADGGGTNGADSQAEDLDFSDGAWEAEIARHAAMNERIRVVGLIRVEAQRLAALDNLVDDYAADKIVDLADAIGIFDDLHQAPKADAEEEAATMAERARIVEVLRRDAERLRDARVTGWGLVRIAADDIERGRFEKGGDL